MKQFLKSVFASTIGFLLAQSLMIFGFLVLVSLTIGVVKAVKVQEHSEVAESEKKILYLELAGQLVERRRYRDLDLGEEVPFLSENRRLSLYQLTQVLKKAAKDAHVKGLYIRMAGLRAGWAALSSLQRELSQFREAGKFIYTFSDGFNESTYYLATASSAIFMYPMGGFELNGLMAVPGFFKETLEKLQIQPRVYRAGAYKSAVEPFVRESMSDESREQVRQLIDDFWNHFAATVVERREIDRERFEQLTQELLVTHAEQAVNEKLVDELKYEDEVREFLRGTIGLEKDKELPLMDVRSYLSHTAAPRSQDLMALAKKEMAERKKGDAHVALVFATGEIVAGRSGEETMGADSLVEILREVREDDDVKAVVLRIDSPGGSALAADEIWREVSLCAQKKPVYASLGNVAASGGYYIAAGARKIYAEPTTVTGSIGVFGLSFMTKEFFKEKLGVSFDRVVSHPYADAGNSTREVSEYEVEVIDREIDRVYARFLKVVSDGRKMDVEKVRRLAGGRVWSGVQAKSNDLVDELGGLKQVLKDVAKAAQLDEEFKVQIWPRPESPIKMVIEYLSEEADALVGWTPRGLRALGSMKEFVRSLERRGVYTLWPLVLTIE